MNSQELYQHLESSCNIFRGVLETRDYKKYVLGFFIYKYISDNSDYDDSSLIEVRFNISNMSHFDSLLEFIDDTNFGDRISDALLDIEKQNECLKGIFNNLDFKETIFNVEKSKLSELYQNFLLLNLQSNDDSENIAAESFSMILEYFAMSEGKRGGEMNTPKGVSILLANLIQPKTNDTIYDSACGSSSLILQVAKSIEGKNNDFQLFGQDINEEAIRISKMQMIINGLENNLSNFRQGNIFSSPKFITENHLSKFDIVVSHPPFSLNKWNAEDSQYDVFNRFHRGTPPKSRGDYAFISHMIESAKENVGIIGIIASYGVLFRGSSEYEIRRKLIEENLLEAVIGLPSNIFTGTSIGGVILIFNKGKKKNTDVLFINASEKYKPGRMLNELKTNDINSIVHIYNQFKSQGRLSNESEDWKRFARIIEYNEIEHHDFNLSISRYIDTFEEAEAVDIEELKIEILEIEKELSLTQEEIKRLLKEIT